MEKLPNPTILEAKKSGQEQQEQITNLGYGTLEEEAGIKVPSHRKAGFMFATFLATSLALFSPVKAEAQFGIGGRGLGSKITKDVLTAGKNTFEMRQNEKIIQIHAEYQEKLGRLIETESQLDQEYHQQKLELREKNDEGALRQLEERYHQEKIKIRQARIKLDQERDTKLANTKIIRDTVGGGIGTARGY